MAKRQGKRERTAPHRLNIYPSQWRMWQAQAKREERTVSSLVRWVMTLYLSAGLKKRKP